MSRDLFIDLETRGRNFIDEWALEFKKRVEKKTPVKTGALQKGYGITRKQTGFELWNIQDYFWYIEEGTRYIAPRRMMGRALMEEPEITRIAIEKAKKKGSKP